MIIINSVPYKEGVGGLAVDTHLKTRDTRTVERPLCLHSLWLSLPVALTTHCVSS